MEAHGSREQRDKLFHTGVETRIQLLQATPGAVVARPMALDRDASGRLDPGGTGP
jgi:hypothetical protein